MIFVTTGTQAPFDRFLKMVDELAGDFDEEVVAQAITSDYEPQNLKMVGFIPPDEFNRIFAEARIVIAHAGMGTIISALTGNKPIIVVPRLAYLGEHRNEHQMVTAMRMNELGYVHVVYDKKQLRELLISSEELQCLRTIDKGASESLVSSLIDFISQKQ
ncbi:MAG: glycosyltransferase [Rikenellaceae bacterium]